MLVNRLLTLVLSLVAAEHAWVDVVVIGGGAAGVAAAAVLHEANVSFLLLEARPVLGGRMHESSFGAYVIEDGANWVHGLCNAQRTKMNPIYEPPSDMNGN